jgi:hypothetical protein
MIIGPTLGGSRAWLERYGMDPTSHKIEGPANLWRCLAWRYLDIVSWRFENRAISQSPIKQGKIQGIKLGSSKEVACQGLTPDRLGRLTEASGASLLWTTEIEAGALCLVLLRCRGRCHSCSETNGLTSAANCWSVMTYDRAGQQVVFKPLCTCRSYM